MTPPQAQVLTDVNVVIPAASVCAIVGKSGRWPGPLVLLPCPASYFTFPPLTSNFYHLHYLRSNSCFPLSCVIFHISTPGCSNAMSYCHIVSRPYSLSHWLLLSYDIFPTHVPLISCHSYCTVTHPLLLILYQSHVSL